MGGCCFDECGGLCGGVLLVCCLEYWWVFLMGLGFFLCRVVVWCVFLRLGH